MYVPCVAPCVIHATLMEVGTDSVRAPKIDELLFGDAVEHRS